MTYRKYPDEKAVNEYIAKKEPLIFAISFDGETVLMSRLDVSLNLPCSAMLRQMMMYLTM